MSKQKNLINFIILWAWLFFMTKNFAISMLAMPLVIQNIILVKLKESSPRLDRFLVEMYQYFCPFFIVIYLLKEKFSIWADYPQSEQFTFIALASLVLALFMQTSIFLTQKKNSPVETR